MKLNWGSGIALFYTFFVIAMVSMVIKSMQHKPHLVQENYYDKDLNYERFRQKRANASLLGDEVKIQYQATAKRLSLSFPKRMSEVKGKVVLFRPSNKFMDQAFDIKLDNMGAMMIPIKKEMKGLWKVKVDWKHKEKAYYKEETITL